MTCFDLFDVAIVFLHGFDFRKKDDSTRKIHTFGRKSEHFKSSYQPSAGAAFKLVRYLSLVSHTFISAIYELARAHFSLVGYKIFGSIIVRKLLLSDRFLDVTSTSARIIPETLIQYSIASTIILESSGKIVYRTTPIFLVLIDYFFFHNHSCKSASLFLQFIRQFTITL